MIPANERNRSISGNSPVKLNKVTFLYDTRSDFIQKPVNCDFNREFQLGRGFDGPEKTFIPAHYRKRKQFVVKNLNDIKLKKQLFNFLKK
jgi:hypothetical protein